MDEHNEHESAFDLTTLFKEHSDKRWLAVSPGGNWGDHLIYAGADKLAEECGVKWQVTDYRFFPEMKVEAGTCIYLHGSGGFNSWGSGRALDILDHATRIPGAVVIQGPQTSEVQDESVKHRLLTIVQNSRCHDFYLLVRELSSLRYLRKLLPDHVSVGLSQDTALALSRNDLLTIAGLATSPRGRYHLLVRREDNEAPDKTLQTRGGAGLLMDPAIYADNFRHWVRIHLFAHSITTNRLHSAILGSIAGIPTTLLPGSYHKNRSVWEYSLASRGVSWSDRWPVFMEKRFELLSVLPAFVQRSWKVQRLAYMLKGMPGS